MNYTKCPNCKLVDIAAEATCRRCGVALYGAAKAASKRTFPLWPMLIAALAIGYFAYSYSGWHGNAPKAGPVPTAQIVPQAQPTLTTRAEYEQNQKAQYKTAIQNSQGIAQSQKRLEETQKLMQPPPKQ